MIGKERLLTNGWQILKFSECIKQLNTGLNPRNHFSLGHGSFKYITAKNLTQFGTIDFSKCDFIDEQAKRIIHRRSDIQVGDILFSSRAPIGHCHLICEKPDDYDIGESIFSIRVNRKIILPDYLCLYMASDYFVRMASLHTTGSIIQEIRISNLMDIDVILPPMNEQRRIAECFKKIDRKIALNNKINDNLQQQLQLLYDYWFKQYDFPDENGNPYRASGGAMTWNEHLKQNMPLNWKEAQLKNIFDVSGKAISREECQTDAYYTPIDVIPKRTITFAGGLPAAEANSSLQLYEENDVLLGAMRVYFHRVCISAQSGITRTTTLVLRPKEAEYLGYAYQVLNDDDAILYATQHSSGTQQPYVNWNDALENYRFAMPSNPKLLYEYSKISEPLIVKAKNCARETEQLTKLRDWLLPMLMNGQATISD